MANSWANSAASYAPPWFLRQGWAMTIYVALWGRRSWQDSTVYGAPPYQEKVFAGAGEVPIYGWVAVPENPRATMVATYGITGSLANQWYLHLLGRQAFARGYAVVLFDWRSHGKTAELSPTLTSDGLYEGEDFLAIAAAAQTMGCPPPFWLAGYSLGGQMALWGIKKAQVAETQEIGGGIAICPNLDSNRSLSYLVQSPIGRYVEQGIAGNLKKLAWRLYHNFPQEIDGDAIERADSIIGFDRELVIPRLGFASVEEYYHASSPLLFLDDLQKPTLIIYAADDPFFDPSIVAELQQISRENAAIDLYLTAHGGHVGYLNSHRRQRQLGDRDRWWAWHRTLDWCDWQLQKR
ncbi:alpha/beta fold hydrolase [Geitlerinema sp. PCC 9228]|jgi:hypothetical protein|uniref:YheT family hydrolase n=1 Tax=Geitlerinema sp. PCC 9228 TaxID=111611 RepID=UPI0008F9D8B1|nr:alpha/beta fold hydrolase [Geitlerinema sp. PCC 9228]